MISLRGKEIQVKRFADKTMRLTLDKDFMPMKRRETIVWRYESDEELVTLIFLTRHLQDHGSRQINLFLPYLPNARMDRVQSDNEVFTLKHFCRVINSLHFHQVTIFDPHSNAGIALLNRVKVLWPSNTIKTIFDELGENTIVCYPDRGSFDRYSNMVKVPSVCFEKRRDWKSREIIYHAMLDTKVDVKGKTVLIIDDICSSGGTLLGVADALKNTYGAAKVYAYVSHCENGATDSNLLKSESCDGLYTTPSIYVSSHPKIHVLDAPWNF